MVRNWRGMIVMEGGCGERRCVVFGSGMACDSDVGPRSGDDLRWSFDFWGIPPMFFEERVSG
jgi:hypothetical protein